MRDLLDFVFPPRLIGPYPTVQPQGAAGPHPGGTHSVLDVSAEPVLRTCSDLRASSLSLGSVRGRQVTLKWCMKQVVWGDNTISLKFGIKLNS